MAKISLIELAKIFLKIGIFSFGGPYAHISLFEDELINNKKLINKKHKKVEHLKNLGINVTKRIPIKINPNKHNKKYLDTKSKKSGHIL